MSDFKLIKHYEFLRDSLNYNPSTGIFNWNIKRKGTKGIGSEAGYIGLNGYRQIGVRVDGKFTLIASHRLAWFITYGELPNIIDHINRDKTDNSISNLRNCNSRQNANNRVLPRNNKSGYKGVSWSSSCNKWHSSLGYKRKTIHLGHFDCPKEASEAYESKAKELFGEFYHEKL